MIPEVSTAVEVVANEPVYHIPIEQVGFLDGLLSERIQQQRAQHATQPIVSRNVETLFLAPQHLGRKFISHQVSEDNFQRGASDLEIFRKSCRKLDDAMIQKWRPNLHRVRHAHAVAFVEDVVRKVVALIQPQLAIQISYLSGLPRQAFEQRSDGRMPVVEMQLPFLGFGKSSVPEQMSFRGIEKGTLQQTLQFILKADLLVGSG